MKLLKKVFSGLVLSLFVLSAVAPMALAQANNSADRNWSYDFWADHFNKLTTSLRKEDYSSTWFEFKTGEVAFVYFRPMGTYSSSPSGGSNCITMDPNYNGSYKVYLGNGGKYVNYVKERGYTYCYLEIYTNGNSGYAKGVWSPDSV